MATLAKMVCAVAVFVYSSPSLASPIAECSVAIRMNREQYHNNITLALSHATLLQSSNSSDTSVAQALQSLSPEGFVDASGNFNHSRVNELRQESDFRFTGQQSEGYFAYYLSQISADAFNRCVESAMQTGGVHIWPVYVDHRIARLAIRRVTPLGGRPPFTVDLLLNGQEGPSQRRLRYDDRGTGEQIIEVRRRRNQPLVIAASYQDTTDDLAIPAYIRVDRVREDSALRNSRDRPASIRGGWDRPPSIGSSWVNIQPEAGWRIDVGTIVPVYDQQYDERGDINPGHALQFAGLNGTDSPSQAGFAYRAYASCRSTEASCFVSGYAQWKEWRWVFNRSTRPDWAERR